LFHGKISGSNENDFYANNVFYKNREAYCGRPLARLLCCGLRGAGVIAAFTLFFLLWDRWLRKPAAHIVVLIVASVFAFIYLLLSVGDVDTMRWMGQRLSLNFLVTYFHGVPDGGIVKAVLGGDPAGFLLDAGILLQWIVGAMLVCRFCTRHRKTV